MIKVKLLDMMEKVGMKSQRELSRLTGISQTTLVKVRRKHSFRSDTLDMLCRALDCQPGDLLAYVPDQDATDDPVRDPDVPFDGTGTAIGPGA